MQTQLKVIAFTDQVGSTTKTAQRTPAEIQRVDREQTSLTVKVAQQYRGMILKDRGDGHMIEFPACSDAALFGFVLQQRVKVRNDAQTNDNLKFDLHVGIDFGEVIVLETGDLRGNAANRAARVCDISPAGEVYFTEKVMKDLNPREAEFVEVGPIPLKGVKEEVTIYRLINWLGKIERAPNPFVWRDGITNAADFFDRDNEQRRLRDFLRQRQNCQIVGPHRIGKTSLLRQIERVASDWDKTAIVAYMNLQDARCSTLSGWLKYLSQQFGWSAPAQSMVDVAESVEAMITKRLHPILCLNEFEEMAARRAEFTSDFLIALRAVGQQGVSIITTSLKPLSEIGLPEYSSSPFYNTFPLLRLGSFSREDAGDFITLHQTGEQSFTEKEKKVVLDYAKGHPLALQVACFHVLEAKKSGEKLTSALRKAKEEMKNHLPNGW